MTAKTIQRPSEIEQILTMIAETILDLPDDQVLDLEEIKKDMLILEAIQIKEIMLDAILEFNKTNFKKAQAVYAQSIDKISKNEFSLPKSFEEKRTLLQSILSKFSKVGNSEITAQFRYFENITEQDVDSALRQLYMLGLMGSDELGNLKSK
jgi:hypothetical protein